MDRYNIHDTLELYIIMYMYRLIDYVSILMLTSAFSC